MFHELAGTHQALRKSTCIFDDYWFVSLAFGGGFAFLFTCDLYACGFEEGFQSFALLFFVGSFEGAKHDVFGVALCFFDGVVGA